MLTGYFAPSVSHLEARVHKTSVTGVTPGFLKKGKSNPEEFNIEKIKVSNRTNICQVLN